MDQDDETVLPCAEKLAFDTEREARAAATVAAYHYGSQLKTYTCRYCHLWHLSSS
ncbi:MAG TPA: hypothetical protein VK983_04445 [Candidatus Limnocylindrales bacterium]|nr:hypothetical protein [Candidatus Limnocylindrales bacterium]